MNSLQDIANLDLLGRPLIFYLGILTYVFLLVTAVLQVLRMKVKWMRQIPRELHHTLAIITLGLATVHGLFSISIYF